MIFAIFKYTAIGYGTILAIGIAGDAFTALVHAIIGAVS